MKIGETDRYENVPRQTATVTNSIQKKHNSNNKNTRTQRVTHKRICLLSIKISQNCKLKWSLYSILLLRKTEFIFHSIAISWQRATSKKKYVYRIMQTRERDGTWMAMAMAAEKIVTRLNINIKRKKKNMFLLLLLLLIGYLFNMQSSYINVLLLFTEIVITSTVSAFSVQDTQMCRVFF